MTDPKPGNVWIIYENDEDDADTQHGDQTESQNSTSGFIPIIYENDDADIMDSQHGEPYSSQNFALPVSNEHLISSDELTSLSFGIDIVKDEQDDSLQGIESIMDPTQSSSLTISSTTSSEDRRSDDNATVDTSSGFSQSIPVVGIDADIHRDTTTDAQSPPAQSDDSTDDPAKLTFSQRLAKMNASSKVSPTPSKREVSVKSSDSVQKSKLLFEEAAAKNAAPVQTPKLEPRSAKTGLSKPFHYTIQQTEGSSLGIDTILSSPLNASKDDGAHETSNPRRTNVKSSFEASKQIAESIKHKIAEGMRNSLGKKLSGDAGPNAMYSVQKPTTHDNAERRPAPTTREINRTAKDKTMVVAAIDFGTTYSAVAFSFKNDPERIICKHWDGQVKVPTAILLNPNKDVDSFGETAKVKFAEKFDDQNTYKDWFYFEHFKMKLYKMYLDRSVMLTDHSGKEMTAIDVFAKALSYMRKELLDLLNKERRGVVISPDSDIHWVLTVPAIWPDMSKTFMRQAAEMANIPSDYLTLALEPEAASLYCRRDLGVSLRGKKYLVLDLGGGTADIVAHEIQNDDSIKECHMACGGDFGGKMVDDGIFKLLDELYGRDVINAFRQTKDYFEFCKEFEKARRVYDGSKGIPLVLPASLNEIFKSKTGQSIEVSIEQSRLRGKVTWTRGSMNISTEFMKNIFDKPLNHILEATAKAINTIGHNETTSQATDTNAGVHHILMVGGFSNSSYIVEGLKQAYPESGFVLIPEEPSIAVIKGAVRFGQEPRAIESRMSKYTYGMGRMMKFKPGDREDFKVFANGTYWCDSCFNKHIEVGEELSTDERREVKAHDYYPPDAGVRQFILEVFASPEPNPRYTTDAGCQCIGRMRLDMDSHGDVWSKIEVKLVYTGTELEIQAYDVQNNKLTIGKVDFLG